MMQIPQYRVRVDYETEPDLHTPEGEALPGSEAAYLANPYRVPADYPRVRPRPEDGGVGYRDMTWEEYLAYYGDPNRHTVVAVSVQQQCPHCGEWKDAGALYNIDMMDDDRELDRVAMGQWEPVHVGIDQRRGHLADVAKELLREAGWSSEYFQRGPQ